METPILLAARDLRSTAVRKAICLWADREYPKLVRSMYGSVVWGRGRQWESYPEPAYWPCGSGWMNAGVRVERGVVIVENYRGREIDRVPLVGLVVKLAVEIVAQMGVPGWAQWEIKDGVGLLVYADWLDEQGKSRWANRVRRWGEIAITNRDTSHVESVGVEQVSEQKEPENLPPLRLDRSESKVLPVLPLGQCWGRLVRKAEADANTASESHRELNYFAWCNPGSRSMS